MPWVFFGPNFLIGKKNIMVWCKRCEGAKVRMSKEKITFYAGLRIKGAAFGKNTTEKKG